VRRKHIDEKTNAVFVNEKIALTRFFSMFSCIENRNSRRHNAHAKTGGFRQIFFAR
jgi:hypothetical protein